MDTDTTMRQIGAGNLMAVGARDFTVDRTTQTLAFRVGSKRGVVAKLVVTLDASDTYTVRYWAMGRGLRTTADESVSGVYADQLGAVVRKMGDR
jgi:hypothetical protein